jgi:hypothetical protein
MSSEQVYERTGAGGSLPRLHKLSAHTDVFLGSFQTATTAWFEIMREKRQSSRRGRRALFTPSRKACDV